MLKSSLCFHRKDGRLLKILRKASGNQNYITFHPSIPWLVSLHNSMVFPFFSTQYFSCKSVARIHGSFSACNFLNFIIVRDDINNFFQDENYELRKGYKVCTWCQISVWVQRYHLLVVCCGTAHLNTELQFPHLWKGISKPKS